MEENINNLYFHIRQRVFGLIKEKNIDIDILSFNLGISRNTFINNFINRINDFSFYLQTISLLENWEE